MKIHQIKKSLGLLLGILITLTACTDQKLILERPRDQLDPKPISREELRERPKEKDLGDPLAENQWAHDALGLEGVWSHEKYTGQDQTKVAVISSGVDYTHEDLAANIWMNHRELEKSEPAQVDASNGKDDDENGYVDDLLGWDVIDQDGLPFDHLGNGTAAAGLLGALHSNGKGIKGVLKDMSIVPIRYIGPNGLGQIPHLVSALEYSIAVGAQVALVDMANMKFAQRARASQKEKIAEVEKTSLQEVLKKAAQAGMPIVVSAGNQSANIPGEHVISTMAQHDHVIVVTSVDQNGEKPWLANSGTQVVDMGAPGVSLMTTMPGQSYGSFSGTLAAASYVSSALALALTVHGNSLPLSEILQKLTSEDGAMDTPDLRLNTVSGRSLKISRFLEAVSR
jgi:subtilisin family serine protease